MRKPAEIVFQRVDSAMHAALQFLGVIRERVVPWVSLSSRSSHALCRSAPRDRAGRADGKHNYRNRVIARKRYGGGVHDAQIAGQNLVIGQPVDSASALGSILGSAE